MPLSLINQSIWRHPSEMTETPKIVKKYALSRRATFTLGLKFIHPALNAVEIKPSQEVSTIFFNSPKTVPKSRISFKLRVSTKPAFPLFSTILNIPSMLPNPAQQETHTPHFPQSQ
jgi:hypothetical protein